MKRPSPSARRGHLAVQQKGEEEVAVLLRDTGVFDLTHNGVAWMFDERVLVLWKRGLRGS